MFFYSKGVPFYSKGFPSVVRDSLLIVREPCPQRLPSGTRGGQEREQEEDQKEVACIAQLVRVGPLMQEVPGSIPSVFCSAKAM